MSAWYDDTPEGPPPPLAPQMMEFQCDYGVLNHATAVPPLWPDGKQELIDVFTCQVVKDAVCVIFPLGVNGDYSQMEFVVEDTDEAGAYWNPYRESTLPSVT